MNKFYTVFWIIIAISLLMFNNQSHAESEKITYLTYEYTLHADDSVNVRVVLVLGNKSNETATGLLKLDGIKIPRDVAKKDVRLLIPPNVRVPWFDVENTEGGGKIVGEVMFDMIEPHSISELALTYKTKNVPVKINGELASSFLVLQDPKYSENFSFILRMPKTNFYCSEFLCFTSLSIHSVIPPVASQLEGDYYKFVWTSPLQTLENGKLQYGSIVRYQYVPDLPNTVVSLAIMGTVIYAVQDIAKRSAAWLRKRKSK